MGNAKFINLSDKFNLPKIITNQHHNLLNRTYEIANSEISIEIVFISLLSISWW